ncbi:outer membrane protein [Pragia fontium]|uniref:Outer membrane protein n=1 Tax=Pragia fontium TaxID=82985 RepID=A0ABQ5LD48_9GAMM|nr:NirD/YgiW/YdeI family stress tolerance protein [Pragia fontium]GKX61546.1 outer membrane protein [Pragia fontium]
MNKLSMLALVAALASTSAVAQNGGFSGPGAVAPETTTTTTQSGGFSGPNTSQTTVDKALKMSDDSWVTLRGNIEQQVGKKRYLFRDETGTINIEVDRKRWNGITVTPKDKVEIQGEIDKDWSSIEVDVKKIVKVN